MPEPLIGMIAKGPRRKLTRWQRITVKWAWWKFRHPRYLWPLRPWIWDWKNWPWHNTTEWDE